MTNTNLNPDMSSNPKVLLYDTEWTSSITHTWSNKPHFLPNDFLIEPARMLCFGAKWLGEKEIEVVDERSGRISMLTQLRDLLSEADMVISFNGQSFDTRKFNSELMKEGILPPAPYKQIDLFRQIKSNASFYSHKLDYISQELGLSMKVATGGFQLWRDVMAGDEVAWEKFREYQKQDVVMLENLFNKVKGWIKMPHPINSADPHSCHNCGGADLSKRGFAPTLNGKYQRYMCNGCGKWLRGMTRENVTELRAAL